MESELTNPLEVLVQSVTRQQQARSDLINRLCNLKNHVEKQDEEITAMVIEERGLRRDSHDVMQGNIALEDRNSMVISATNLERESRSSLILTLESLNEKKKVLNGIVSDNKGAYDEETNAIREKIEFSAELLTNLLENQGKICNERLKKLSYFLDKRLILFHLPNASYISYINNFMIRNYEISWGCFALRNS